MYTCSHCLLNMKHRDYSTTCTHHISVSLTREVKIGHLQAVHLTLLWTLLRQLTSFQCTLLYIITMTMHSVQIKGGVLFQEYFCTLLRVAGTKHATLLNLLLTLSILFHSLLTSISCSCSNVFSRSIFSLRSCVCMPTYTHSLYM